MEIYENYKEKKYFDYVLSFFKLYRFLLSNYCNAALGKYKQLNYLTQISIYFIYRQYIHPLQLVIRYLLNFNL